MTIPNHEISIRVGTKTIERWTNYSFTLDIGNPSDSFSLGIGPGTRDVWEQVKPDREVSILVDGVELMTGYIDERVRHGGGEIDSQIEVHGRDKVGRMLDESAGLQEFGSQTLGELAKGLSSDLFKRVVFSNKENRDRMLIRSGKARAGREPIFTDRSTAPVKVDPGQTVWSVLEQFLRRAELIAWSDARGDALVIGLPNYDQEPQYRFVIPAPGSRFAADSNVEEYSITESLADQYSMITVVGSNAGSKISYGSSVTRNMASVFDGIGALGVGLAFERRKLLIMPEDDLDSPAEAQAIARREMDLRRAGRNVIELKVSGHSQQLTRTAAPALYVPDKIAEVIDEETGLRADYLVRRVAYSSGESPMTDLLLIPKGTKLAL